MLPMILSAVGVPLLSKIIAGALARVDHPVARQAAKALTDLDIDLPSEAITQANKGAQELAMMEMEQEGSALAQVNKTIQREIISKDAFVRRMRPTFGYLMALTWACQMLGVAYVIVFDPTRASDVLAGMGQLTGIWAIGLSVLGIYVYKRSEDKRLSGGL